MVISLTCTAINISILFQRTPSYMNTEIITLATFPVFGLNPAGSFYSPSLECGDQRNDLFSVCLIAYKGLMDSRDRSTKLYGWITWSSADEWDYFPSVFTWYISSNIETNCEPLMTTGHEHLVKKLSQIHLHFCLLGSIYLFLRLSSSPSRGRIFPSSVDLVVLGRLPPAPTHPPSHTHTHTVLLRPYIPFWKPLYWVNLSLSCLCFSSLF